MIELYRKRSLAEKPKHANGQGNVGKGKKGEEDTELRSKLLQRRKSVHGPASDESESESDNDEWK